MTSENTQDAVVLTPFKKMVVLDTKGGAQGRLFQGVFGELVNQTDDGVLTIKLDSELIECSTLLAPYKDSAFQIHESEAVIIDVPSQVQYNSLRATLAHLLSEKWNGHYEQFIHHPSTSSHMDVQPFIVNALKMEQEKANQAVDALIHNAGAKKAFVPVALIINVDEGDITEMDVAYLDAIALGESVEEVLPTQTEGTLCEELFEDGVYFAKATRAVYLDRSDESKAANEQKNQLLDLLFEHPSLKRMVDAPLLNQVSDLPFVLLDNNRQDEALQQAATRLLIDSEEAIQTPSYPHLPTPTA